MSLLSRCRYFAGNLRYGHCENKPDVNYEYRKGFWVFPSEFDNQTIKDALRADGYYINGFQSEVCSAFRGWKRVDAMNFKRGRTRVLVTQEVRINY